MNQAKNLDEFVASGANELKAIADTNNSIAHEWHVKIKEAQTTHQKLFLFGEMRVTLMRDMRPEARAIMERMYPE